MPATIFALTFTHANGALTSGSSAFQNVFRQAGHEVEILDMAIAAEVERLSAALKAGSVPFCFGIQGVGSRLSTGGENLWGKYKVPFLCLHHDTPSGNLYNHFNASAYVGNLYMFECLYDIQKQFVQSTQFTAHLPYEIWGPPAHVPKNFGKREIRISFLKTGHDPKYFADQIDTIMQPLRDAVWDRLREAGHNANLDLCILLAAAFKDSGIDYREHLAAFWAIAGWMDNYVRAKRAVRLVEWLKYKEGAVIAGEGWDFIDKTNVKALFKPGMPAGQSVKLYVDTQFMCNTSPYGYDIIHERVINGLYRKCFVLSDANDWWDQNFGDVPSLRLHDWGSDDFADFEAALADPQAAAKAGSDAGTVRCHEKLYGGQTVKRMFDCAEKIRRQAEANPLAVSSVAALDIKPA